MKSFNGIIIGGDVLEKTFKVKCSTGVEGVEIGKMVIVIPVTDSRLTEFDNLLIRLKQINPNYEIV